MNVVLLTLQTTVFARRWSSVFVCDKLPEKSTSKARQKKKGRLPKARKPWISEDIIYDIEERDRLYKVWKRTHRPADRKAFIEQRNRTNAEVREAKRKHEAAAAKVHISDKIYKCCAFVKKRILFVVKKNMGGSCADGS